MISVFIINELEWAWGPRWRCLAKLQEVCAMKGILRLPFSFALAARRRILAQDDRVYKEVT
jgi:hypothetical protein